MNLTDFINKYKGTRVEYDNVSYYQCVDLVKMYAKKVLELEFGAFGNAKDYFNGFNSHSVLKNNFKRIANSSNFIPQRGDIVIWGNGKYGHIAVATGEGTTSWFNSFDQNYGLNKKCRIVKHNYKNFLGVLRPNNQEAIYGKQDSIDYNAHVQNIGWQKGFKNGEVAGTYGSSLRIEAIVINSTVPLQYRVHIQDIGWQDWRGLGCIAGTTGKSKRIEAIQIISNKPLKARGHIENIGWKDYEGENIIIGTEGKGLRLEAFSLKFKK